MCVFTVKIKYMTRTTRVIACEGCKSVFPLAKINAHREQCTQIKQENPTDITPWNVMKIVLLVIFLTNLPYILTVIDGAVTVLRVPLTVISTVI